MLPFGMDLRLQWLTRDVRAWALYDVATSTWIGVIPTILYALYFRVVIAEGRADVDALWALTVAASLLISGVLAPWIGARADLTGSRLQWLIAATAICCLATAAMALLGPGQILAGALVFVCAQVGYTVGMSLYESYLTQLATPDTMGRVSAFGFSAGFFGGIVALVACIGLLGGVDVGHDPAFTASFLLIAGMFAVAAVPAVRGLARLKARPPAAVTAERESAARRLLGSIRAWRDHQNAVKFLAALYLINDALVTIAFFAGIFLREQFGLGLTDLLKLLLLYQVVAIPATLVFGRLADRVSPHTAVYSSLLVWTLAVCLMAFGSGAYVPIVVVVLLATVFGSTQAVMRGVYALLIPPAQAGEFFGFNALAGRLSAAMGPLLYGIVSAVTGSAQAAILSVLVFLAAGALVLATVRIEQPAMRGAGHASGNG